VTLNEVLGSAALHNEIMADVSVKPGTKVTISTVIEFTDGYGKAMQAKSKAVVKVPLRKRWWQI